MIVTEAACHFIDFDNAALQRVSVFRDKDEWSGWSGIGDQVLHIEVCCVCVCVCACVCVCVCGAQLIYFFHVSIRLVVIQLRKWADAMLIAPLSANTLAKISNGQCDNLLV